jgi:hypothetical protein
MPTNRTFQLDVDTKRYIARVNTHRKINGINPLLPPDIADIDNFVVGLKDLGVWQNISCWPMRSIHNVGSGSSVICLGGKPFNGNLVASPIWSTTGITFDFATQNMNINGLGLSKSPFMAGMVITLITGSGTNTVELRESIGTNRGQLSCRVYAGNNWITGLFGVTVVWTNTSFTAKTNGTTSHWQFGHSSGTAGILSLNGGPDTGILNNSSWDLKSTGSTGNTLSLLGTSGVVSTCPFIYVLNDKVINRASMHQAVTNLTKGITLS